MKNLTIQFANASTMCLYFMEMEGQISDGKYENSRPFNHWHWVGDIKDAIINTEELGIKSSGLRNSRWSYVIKNYNLREWPGYINKWRKKKDEDYEWATRIIAFGKFGRIYPNIDYNTLMRLGEIRIFLEELQISIEDGITDPEKLFNKIIDFRNCPWREKYYEDSKDYFNIEFIKKYLDLSYDLKEVKEDLNLMYKSINTIL